MEIAFGYFVKAFILPPGINIFAALAGMLLFRRSPRIRQSILGIAIGSLWIWSTPVVSAWLAHSLEDYDVLATRMPGDAEVVVVIGGGRYSHAPEYASEDTVAGDTLERIRYAARLARDLRLPLAVAGGSVLRENSQSLGQLMAAVLKDELHPPVRWVEGRSRNTAQNASELHKVLPHDRIILVTHAIHMQRSKWVFERVGFKVTPAPMGFSSRKKISYDLFAWLPSISALGTSRAVLHEWVGMAYYQLRY